MASDRRARGEGRSLALTDPVAALTVMAEQAFGWFVDRGMEHAMRVDPVVPHVEREAVLARLAAPDRRA